MGELVYKEWLPLSEADKEHPKLVKWEDEYEKAAVVAYFEDGVWRYDEREINILSADEVKKMQFLCLTPTGDIEKER